MNTDGVVFSSQEYFMLYQDAQFGIGGKIGMPRN